MQHTISAFGKAKEAVEEHGSLPVPIHLRQASTPLMRKMGHGKDYRYPHDFPDHWVAQQYLPDALVGTRFYAPSDSGEEEKLRRRLAELRAREKQEPKG